MIHAISSVFRDIVSRVSRAPHPIHTRNFSNIPRSSIPDDLSSIHGDCRLYHNITVWRFYLDESYRFSADETTMATTVPLLPRNTTHFARRQYNTRRRRRLRGRRPWGCLLEVTPYWSTCYKHRVCERSSSAEYSVLIYIRIRCSPCWCCLVIIMTVPIIMFVKRGEPRGNGYAGRKKKLREK